LKENKTWPEFTEKQKTCYVEIIDLFQLPFRFIVMSEQCRHW